MMRILQRTTLALTVLLAAQAALAGGGPAGYVVVYNPTDPRSVTIANEYQQRRGIPERNMFPYVFPASFSRTTAWDFMYAFRAAVTSRGLDAQLQGVALAGITPLDSAQQISGQYVFSLHSFIFLSPNYSQASFPTAANAFQNAYAQPQTIFGLAPTGTVALTAATVFSGQKYLPVSSIGFPGKSGNSTPEILGFIDRAAARDGLKPGGTVYWPLNPDVRSTTREGEIYDVEYVWKTRGISYVVTGSASASGNAWISDRRDIAGGVVGIATFTDIGNAYMPGAWVDHLTSNGGSLDTFNPPQTPLTSWLRAGADGSSGTMAEPYAIQQKFPHAHIQTHLRAGASLAEAFWLSLKQPAEIVCAGDPLLQPYADFPAVTVSAPADGATVSGTIAISATAAPTGGKTLEANLDLFVDGRRINIGGAGEPVSVARTGGGFALATTTLSDGWHELRVVAYNNDPVRTQGEGVFAFLVNNLGQSIALTGPATVNPDGPASFTVTPTGLGDLTALALQANGRTLTNLSVAGGAVTLNLTNSAAFAPLTNNWTLFAVGTRSSGQQVWSAPFTTPVAWAAMPASNAVLGAAMADVRVFLSTTNSTFNWDTATPDAFTNFPGNASSGLNITNNSFAGLTLTNFATRPGFDMKLWFYAPMDDWYEIGFEYNGYSQNRICLLDGQSLTERNYIFGPRRLAPGWHVLRARSAFNNAAWTFWKVKLRGGTSQDFVNFTRAATANDGTGVAAATPTIVAVTPSAAPVTGTAVTLTANATIGSGTPGELANLTYHWALLSGPKAVTFSSNGAAAVPATTVTFTSAGNYLLGLRVAGLTNSTATSLPVTVQQTVSGLTLSTGLLTNPLRGLPFDVYAFTKDQFGRRMEIAGTNTNQPTMQWSSTDPNGTFTLVSTNGETAQFCSMSAVSSAQSFTLTASGVNGRTGSASVGITVQTNAAPSLNSVLLFSISQLSAGQPLTLNASFNDPESSTYKYPLLTFHWVVVSNPPGQTMTLDRDDSQLATATFTGPGTYAVQFTATDQAGATLSETQMITVDASGVATFPQNIGSPYSQTVNVGDMATFTTYAYNPTGFWWQSSSDGGTNWLNIPGANGLGIDYGPSAVSDSGRLFRILFSNSVGTVTSDVAKLTVNGATNGVIGIVGAKKNGGTTITVPETVGTVTFSVRRSGGSNGAVSVNWALYGSSPAATAGADFLGPDGSNTYSGVLTWAAGDSSDRVFNIPIVNDAIPEFNEIFYPWLWTATGGAILGTGNRVNYTIVDDDGPGKASFASSSYSFSESDGNAILVVHRDSPFIGTLAVNYATASGTALAGQGFVASTGVVSWADGDTTDKQIIVPLINDPFIRGDLQFTVRLTASSFWLGSPTTAMVTLHDAPFQRWQQQWWANQIPAQPVFTNLGAGFAFFAPLFAFRFGETSGANIFGVDAAGAVVATGTLTSSGGSYALAETGPRPPSWPGLEAANTAVSFTASGNTGAPAQFSAGASANCGTANGLGPRLKSGFTFLTFINTSVTNRQMKILEGLRAGTTNTVFSVTINRAFNNSTTTVAHSLRAYIHPEASGSSWEYSVVLQGQPSGSLCDGQWHHIAITYPAFTGPDNADFPHFYFDGAEANVLGVRGTENVSSSSVFTNFYDTGLRIGSDGAAAPSAFFSGLLDELAIIPSVLTASNIANLAAARPPTPLPSYTGETSNPSGDGIPNLMKYALGLDPLTVATSGLPTFFLDSNVFTYSFTRLRDASDITYRVISTPEIPTNFWTEIWTSAANAYPSLAPNILQAVPIDITGASKGFFKLRITKP